MSKEQQKQFADMVNSYSAQQHVEHNKRAHERVRFYHFIYIFANSTRFLTFSSIVSFYFSSRLSLDYFYHSHISTISSLFCKPNNIQQTN